MDPTKINNMLISKDKNMRRLGRLMLEKLPAKMDDMDKILLYLNGGVSYGEKGKYLFLKQKREIKNLRNLLSHLLKNGITTVTQYLLMDIENEYKKVKKLSVFFKERTLVGEFLKENSEKIIDISTNWYDYDDD